MKFYRYEVTVYYRLGAKLELLEYDFVSETPKGYWIITSGYGNNQWWVDRFKKWIPKKSKKRFAYPTKKEALIGYIKRSEQRIRILEEQMRTTTQGLSQAEYYLIKLEEDEKVSSRAKRISF